MVEPNYQSATHHCTINPPNNGDNGVGKLLARLAPIPAPAIEEKLLLPDGCVVARLTLAE
jgi:hypothetical protein